MADFIISGSKRIGERFMWNYDYDQLCNDELYHWGKKGMRWGHRNKKAAPGMKK